MYTVSQKNTGQLIFHYNFGKCEPIYNIIAP